MWGSMRQKESWVRLGPISLASHLSFSSISLTGLSDGLAGNHHPCIYRHILPPASFNTTAHMQKKCPGPSYFKACLHMRVSSSIVYQMSAIYLIKRNCMPFYFWWIMSSKNCLWVSCKFGWEAKYNIASGFLVFYFAFGLNEVSESQLPENAKGSLVACCYARVIIRDRALFFSFSSLK